MVSKSSVLIVDLLDVGEMGICQDLSDSDKCQIIMARQLDQSISKKARLMGCSQSAVSIYYQ